MGTIVIKDKVRFTLVIIALVQAAVILFLLQRKCCDCSSEPVSIKIDSIRPKDITPKVISNQVPVPVKSIPRAKFIQKAKPVLKPTHAINAQVNSNSFHGLVKPEVDSVGSTAASALNPCDTINIYADTIQKPDTCTFIINDTVEGRILGRSILYANLQPMIRTTIEKTLKEKWKVYVGGAFTFNAKEFSRWGIGVTGALAIPKLGMVDYTYDIRNNAHTVGVLALIRFKK